jgi:translation initiation factor IF-2
VEQKPAAVPEVVPEARAAVEPVELYRSAVEKLSGPTVVGRIDLDAIQPKKKPVASSSDFDKKKKKRKRIKKDGANKPVGEGGAPKPATPSENKPKVQQSSPGPLRFVKKDNRERNAAGTLVPQTPGSDKNRGGAGKKKPVLRQEVNEVDVQKQIKDTLARLTGKGKSKGSKYRREKRDMVSQRHMAEQELAEQDKNIIKITEFVSVNELASMMDVPVTDVIETCMNMGLMVSINQRLDAETLALVADEFNYKVEFVSIEIQEAIKSEEDAAEDLISRPPIVTVMGHVDHGKTSLLDHIRHANVIAGEAGGITQHIGAYSVTLEDGRVITFLDTPGHEAFTAMRARGAKLTDVAIIVIAADDSIMPQTVEAINHASAAGVPIVFAINKIDKPGANPEKIKEALAGMNYLVEDWGGKYQCQEISAKKGTNMDLLLEKVLLEAELLELKANPNKKAVGGVIESSLDKGRGYMTTVLVEAGTLRIGDFVLAGTHTGRVKAMFNERNKRITEAGPSTPVLVLGLNGAPQAGDRFNILDTEKEAKEIATKREQLLRLQGLRSQKHITLDEIGRRIAIGNFQEINIIVKGDVDGSVEALTDSLVKLSTPEIQVNVIHKGVGQISESDVLLADASNAIVIGFQVRPSSGARKLADKEGIDIRLYSIIYDAINELKAAMEGMLSPDFKEEVVASLEVIEVYNITKVGNVAGCIVREGKITRNTKVRVVRNGIVVHTGELGSLKRFKDDVKDVANGYECGLNINKFNDLQVGDVIEGYDMVEVKKKL